MPKPSRLSPPPSSLHRHSRRGCAAERPPRRSQPRKPSFSSGETDATMALAPLTLPAPAVPEIDQKPNHREYDGLRPVSPPWFPYRFAHGRTLVCHRLWVLLPWFPYRFAHGRTRMANGGPMHMPWFPYRFAHGRTAHGFDDTDFQPWFPYRFAHGRTYP